MDTEADIALMKPRSAKPIIAAAVVGLVLGAGLCAAALTLGGKKAQRPAPAASVKCPPPAVSVAAPASASASASAMPKLALLPKASPLAERAARGEADAVSEITARGLEARSADEAFALASAHAADKRKEILEIQRKIGLLAKYAEDSATLARIRKLAADREVTADVLRSLAELPSPTGADLIYHVFSRTPGKNETTDLAEQLLYSKGVRDKASDALGVNLDLRREVAKTDNCEAVAKLLPAVATKGDRRVLTSLAKLDNKRGCGEKERDDCWACLRKTDLIKDAVKGAAARKSTF